MKRHKPSEWILLVLAWFFVAVFAFGLNGGFNR